MYCTDNAIGCDQLESLIHGNWSAILNASSSVESVEEARLPAGDGWCSEALLGAQAPWLEATLPQQARIEVLSISGSVTSHSTSFYLQYGEIREDQPWQCSAYVQVCNIIQSRCALADISFHIYHCRGQSVCQMVQVMTQSITSH